jgi:hypothetical protein
LISFGELPGIIGVRGWGKGGTRKSVYKSCLLIVGQKTVIAGTI